MSKDCESLNAPRDSGLSPLGKATVGRWFARRHESPLVRLYARATIGSARYWLTYVSRRRVG